MAAAIIPAVIGGFVGHTVATRQAKKKKGFIGQVADKAQATADAKSTAQQQQQGGNKQAAAFLKNRNAKGFGANPNTAKPFLLAL